MSILNLTNVNPDDVPELAPVPAGEEYNIRVVSVTTGTDKNGNDYFLPRFEVVGEDACPEFTKFYSIPNQDKMDKKKFDSTVRALVKLGQALDVDFFSQEIDLENDLVGLECYAILGVGEEDEYGKSNYIRSGGR